LRRGAIVEIPAVFWYFHWHNADGGFMTEIAEKIRAVLDKKLVSFVSVMDLDEAARGEGTPIQFSNFGPIMHEVKDTEIVLTMKHEVPVTEMLVIPLADDMIIETAPCGKRPGLSDDEATFSLKILSNSLRLIAGLDYVDKAV
jgi:hypothetical protein